jgi:asparagine synthetase B (glutamine-hydrolysing)
MVLLDHQSLPADHVVLSDGPLLIRPAALTITPYPRASEAAQQPPVRRPGHRPTADAHSDPGTVWTRGVELRRHDDRLEFCGDQFGLSPVYYRQVPEGLMIGNNLAELAACSGPVSLDLQAIISFLRLGFYLHQETPFHDIRLLPAGGRLAYDRAGRTAVTENRRHPVPLRLDRKEAQQAFQDLFCQSMAHLPDARDVVIPLSGGADSRHILLEWLRQGRPLSRCVTVALDNFAAGSDEEIARQLCQRTGTPHHAVPRLPAGKLREGELAKNAEISFESLEHAWYRAMQDEFARNPASMLLDGLAGDVLSAGHRATPALLSAFRSHSWDDAADLLLHNTPGAGLVRALFGRQAERIASEDDTRRRLIQELVRHADAPSPVASFVFWNRTRRNVSRIPVDMLSMVPHVGLPFLTEDLFDLLLGLPGEFFIDQQFHREVMRTHYPSYGDLPYSAKGSPQYRRSEYRSLARQFFSDTLPRRKSVTSGNPRMLVGVAVAAISGAARGQWYGPGLAYLNQLEAIVRTARRTGPGHDR